MTTDRGLTTMNGRAEATAALPVLSAADFSGHVRSRLAAGERVVAYFGQRLGEGDVRIVAVTADDVRHRLTAAAAHVSGSFPSVSSSWPQAQLFEREVLEQTGARPEGHPWLKPVRSHEDPYPFYAVGGEEVHEVAVGPVHAGVIEPGHFRFQCLGEEVLHLEIQLGYQHRGVEGALAGGPGLRTLPLLETTAGDSSVAYATAYSELREALGGIEAPPRAQALRALALELERIANHIGDVGALANDVGFLPAAAYCGGLRGDALNLTADICGSRLGRGLVRPGGVAFDLTEDAAHRMSDRLAGVGAAFERAAALVFNSPSCLQRFAGAGPLSREAAADLGLVGVSARASGLARDVRLDHPHGWWEGAALAVSTEDDGDVLARAAVRRREVTRSVAFARTLLEGLPSGPTLMPCPAPRPERFAVSLVEGWRGEVAHVALTDDQGRFARYKIVDPSFHNWPGLAFAMRGQPISDFPLCNKSFNLSYCGFDL